MYRPKKFIIEILLTAGIILGMLVLKIHVPKYITNHTESANTNTNTMIWQVDKLEISFESTFAKPCFCVGMTEANALAEDIKGLIILVITWLN